LAYEPNEGLVGDTLTQHPLEAVVVEIGEKSLDVRLYHIPEAAILQIEAQGLHRVPGTDPCPVPEAHG